MSDPALKPSPRARIAGTLIPAGGGTKTGSRETAWAVFAIVTLLTVAAVATLDLVTLEAVMPLMTAVDLGALAMIGGAYGLQKLRLKGP